MNGEKTIMKDLSKMLEVKCDCSETVDWHELKEFQGGLKSRDDSDYEKMKTSLLKYGWSFVMYYWNDGKTKWILDGHNRKQVLQKLEEEGYFIPPLPAIEVYAKDMKEAKQKLLRLNSQYGKMTKESVLEFVGGEFELSTEEIALPNGLINFDNDDEEKYTKKVQSPIYEPTEKEPPTIKMLYDDERQKKFFEQIENSELDEEVKQFLILASYRFVKFDFTKIAEYYAHIKSSEEKELFELLALIIIDYDKAIENGFVEMQSELEKLFRSEETDD